MKPEKDCFWVGAPPNATADSPLRPEISLQSTETDGKPDDQLICCGYVPVVLAKMYGPLIFADIRIRANSETCEWIIERENIKTMEWVEVIRIPGQIESEFKDKLDGLVLTLGKCTHVGIKGEEYKLAEPPNDKGQR